MLAGYSATFPNAWPRTPACPQMPQPWFWSQNPALCRWLGVARQACPCDGQAGMLSPRAVCGSAGCRRKKIPPRQPTTTQAFSNCRIVGRHVQRQQNIDDDHQDIGAKNSSNPPLPPPNRVPPITTAAKVGNGRELPTSGSPDPVWALTKTPASPYSPPART
ncbi:MAG: hypothetical protein ACI8R4_002680 [Paracoccaceae bacterium]|jgi:hypothetical protein